MKDAFYWSFFRVAQALPERVLICLGRGLGRIMWAVLGSRRRESTRSVQERLNLSPDWAKVVAKASFINSGQSFMEIFMTRNVDWRFLDRVEIPDMASLVALAELDRPIIGVTGHMGAWELLAGMLNLFVPEGRPNQVVVRLPKDRELGLLMLHMRTLARVEIVRHRQAVKSVLRCLRKNGVSAFLVDHNTMVEEATFIPFLGLEAAVNIGPAVLAVRSQATILPIFLVRREPKGYRLVWETPLDTRDLQGPIGERIEAAARFYTEAVERIVRAYPEQWFWMHRRWKTRPEDCL
ncbi:MAG: acyltransferase [Deltaproteobacteria bacterium]|nr:acyltransferase [Deltaproteobacteria bacterium]